MVKRRSRNKKKTSRQAVSRGDEPPDPITALLSSTAFWTATAASAVGAGVTSGIGALTKGKSGGGMAQSASPLQGITDPNADEKSRRGIMPISSSPLGDTTNPNLSRGRLLGN